MARYIDRDKIEYELILAANGHFVVAARKELIDRLPVEDVEPAKSIIAADIKKQADDERRKWNTVALAFFSLGLGLAQAARLVAEILRNILN